MSSSRRTFFIQSLSGSAAFAALAASGTAFAQTPAAVLDTDPQALALGYKTDGSKTDKAKYPNYAANQSCSGCVLFQGKATDSSSPCAVLGRRGPSLDCVTNGCAYWS